VPLALRLFLPGSWLQAPARLDKAGVPEDQRRALSKGEIALELLEAVRAEGVLPGQVVVADSGYGVSGPLRAGLTARGLHYLLGVTGEMVVFTEPPRWRAPLSARPWSARRAAARSRPALRGLHASDESARGGRADPAAQGHLERGNQGADGRPLRLAAGVARPRLWPLGTVPRRNRSGF
jgi:SRSO17 transposase